jgi:hypothetical protein
MRRLDRDTLITLWALAAVMGAVAYVVYLGVYF